MNEPTLVRHPLLLLLLLSGGGGGGTRMLGENWLPPVHFSRHLLSLFFSNFLQNLDQPRTAAESDALRRVLPVDCTVLTLGHSGPPFKPPFTDGGIALVSALCKTTIKGSNLKSVHLDIDPQHPFLSEEAMLLWIKVYTKHAFDHEKFPALRFPSISLTMEALGILCEMSPGGQDFEMAIAAALATAPLKNKPFPLTIDYGYPQDTKGWHCLLKILIRSAGLAARSLSEVSKMNIDTLPFALVRSPPRKVPKGSMSQLLEKMNDAMNDAIKKEQQRFESAPTAPAGATLGPTGRSTARVQATMTPGSTFAAPAGATLGPTGSSTARVQNATTMNPAVNSSSAAAVAQTGTTAAAVAFTTANPAAAPMITTTTTAAAVSSAPEPSDWTKQAKNDVRESKFSVRSAE